MLFIRSSSSSVSSTYGSWAEEQNLHHQHHQCVWQAGSSGMQMSFFHSLFIRTNKEPLSHEIHLIKIIRHFEHSSPPPDCCNYLKTQQLTNCYNHIWWCWEGNTNVNGELFLEDWRFMRSFDIYIKMKIWKYADLRKKIIFI